MPWRLIIIIAVFVIFLVFISFNLDEEYKSDINFGFTKIVGIPVFLTVFTSFILGLLSSIPLILQIMKKQNEIPLDKKYVKKDIPIEVPAEPGSAEKIKQDAAEAKKRLFSKKRGG